MEQYHIGAVGAVIAWFNSKGYKLSAELLDNALVNKTLNSWYYPYYGNRVDSSSVFISIKNNMTDSSGSGIFLKDGSVNGNDLY
ncbi:MAG: hypothetical protein K5653_06300, partial [Clostridiales bacterium]|nr:hypothetical protein [Clostridiales bacterium]